VETLVQLLIAAALTLTAPAAAPGAATPPHRVDCERPRTLLLHRFEDRSARLECGGRILVRVSVPG
jgi:hypothetical protein